MANWQALRFLTVGPDGHIEWDKLPHIAVYRGHILDNLTATSNAGAVAHAYGVRVREKNFGLDDLTGLPIVNAVGRRETLMQEAKRRGLRVGVINSGSITEPGTAVFLASAKNRDDYEVIAAGVLESGADIIMGGGEEWLLPEGVIGRHGVGRRTDQRNLILEAQSRGYIVVYDKTELVNTTSNTTKLLGVFANKHTFRDLPQDVLTAQNKSHYCESAPTVAEMTHKALEILQGSRFFLVVEEEGADNFANLNNAPGVLEALRRADEALGVARKFLQHNPDTLVVTTADSEAGGWDVIGINPDCHEQRKYVMMGRDSNGAPYGLNASGEPFLTAPDATGRRLEFVLTWATKSDTSGGIIVRAEGKDADKVRGSLSNIDIYAIMRGALFSDGLDE